MEGQSRLRSGWDLKLLRSLRRPLLSKQLRNAADFSSKKTKKRRDRKIGLSDPHQNSIRKLSIKNAKPDFDFAFKIFMTLY